MRIAFLTAFGPQQGTLFRWINLAKGLQQLGHEVTVYGIETYASAARVEELRDGIPHCLLRASRGQRWLGGFSHPSNVLRQAFSSLPSGLDVLHAFQPFSVTCLPGLLRRGSARALLWDWDDLWWGGLLPLDGSRNAAFGRLNTAMVRLLEQRMGGWADAVTTCSAFLAARAKASGASAVHVMGNGLWPGKARLPREEARARLGLQPGAFYCGFMGRTIHELDWCLDALRESAALRPDLRLALCGMSEDALALVPAELRARIDYLGMLTPEQATVFAQALNCGLLPLEDMDFNRSRFPIKFAEYLAAGVDLLCSAVGELAALAEGMEGVVLAGTSRDSWQAALRHYLQSDLSCHDLAARDAQLADRLSWQSIATGLANFYSTILATR